MNPPRSRGMLSLVAGALFILSLAGVALETRTIVARLGSEPDIAKVNASAELAAVLLADATPDAKAGAPKTYQCNPGQVQRIKQESKTSPPKPETSTCYINKKETASARTNEICGFSHPDRCIVQYCYPIASSRDGKSEVCQPVKCQNESGAECFRRAFTTAQKEGPAGMARTTALVDPNAGAIVRGPNGELDTSKFLTQALSPDIWKEVEKTDTGDDGDAAEKILKIAQAGLASKPPCDTSSASCRPSLHLNKELKEAHARLNPCASNPAACQGGGLGDGQERGTLRIPGGAGLPPPPLRPPQQQQQQRPPTPSQSFQCTSAAQPPTPCEGGTWQPQYGSGNCVTGWICAPSGTVGPPPPAPVIALVANPSSITASSTSVLGWVTVGMQSCLISSPAHPAFTAENANNTSVSGTARTPALATSTPFVLTCKTASGDTKAATTTVNVTLAAASRDAQFAAAVLADAAPIPRAAPKPRQYGCDAGQVQTLRQASSGVPPKITPSTCFSKDSSGRAARTASAAKDRSCQLSRPDRCVVQYCPPKDALRNNKTGTCFVVSCGSVTGTECLTQTLATIQSEGPVGVIRNTLLTDPKTAAVAPGQGVINGNEFLTQALNPTIAAQLRTETGSSAFDRIKGIADAIEKGSAPCNNCTPTLHLNKELATEWARIGGKAPPGPGVQSGPGAQTGPQSDNTGFKFPNITKEPSGTDVLAWMSRLFGADKPKEQPQPPRPGGGGSTCVNTPQPAASLCQGGSWESISPEGTSGNSLGSCAANWRCVIPRIISYKAVPESVKSGETVNLGWVTEGMKSCTISSPDLPAWTEENKSYTNVNGTVKSPVLTGTTRFELSCTTKAGVAFAIKLLSVGVLP